MEKKPKPTEAIPEIDIDKMAENPGLLPYAHTAGGAVVKPEDKGKIKGRAVAAMHQQTERQMGQLYEQMQTLARQAKALQQRREVSERIYAAQLNNEPLIGHTYYLYEREDGTDVLSLVAPHEWGRSQRFSRYIASATMLADHTWDVEFNEEGDDGVVE